MSRSPKSRRIKGTQTGISPDQHARVRQQLSEILKQINSSDPNRAANAITQLVRKHPSFAEVNHVASGFYAQTGSRDQAIYYAKRAAEFSPGIAEYHSTLGILMVQSEMYAQAIEHLDRALTLNPEMDKALAAMGVAYLQTGQIAQARSTFTTALERSADNYEAAMNLALLESDLANAHRAVTLMQDTIARFPDNPVLHDSLSMFACYDDLLSQEEVFEIHRAFGRCVQSLVNPPRAYPNTPDPDKRIRIGFVSPDFKEHSIAYFIEPIFEHLDRTRFELCVYSTGSHADEVTARLKSCADLWRDCHGPIANTHKQIVKDRVDLLVELTGHFASNLLPVFAARPAPLSISMIGYANTTGLESIDARLVDPITDPQPDADALASEQLIRLDGCFLCYRPPEDTPEIQATDPDRPFTFGSFNDLRKMSPAALRTWAAILKANPDSRLVLKTSRLAEQEVQDDFRARFADLDIEESRIELLGRTKTTRDHLSLYNRIDCSLDTFPYTGTTTTCESLVMGVPMVTLLGKAHAGRVSASLASAIGASELIAESESAYIQAASRYAKAGPRTPEARKELRDRLTNSALVDEPAYTRRFEAACRSLWNSWCDQHPDQQGTHR